MVGEEEYRVRDLWICNVPLAPLRPPYLAPLTRSDVHAREVLPIPHAHPAAQELESLLCPSSSPRSLLSRLHPRLVHTLRRHAALFLFKCWSFFLAVEQSSPTGISERIIVDLLLHTDRLTHKWPAMLMDAMKVRFAPLPTRCAHLWAAPSRPYYPGWGEAWFDRPSAAWALTSTLLGEPLRYEYRYEQSSGPLSGPLGMGAEFRAAPYVLQSSTQAASPAQGGVRVGLLDRTDRDSSEVYRRWPHAATLVEMVRRERPSDIASATAFTLDGNQTLKDQAAHVRTYDVIVTTHGSQSVSLAFIRPCTVFIEILSADYLVPGLFGQLVEDAGGVAFFLHAARDVNEAMQRTVAPLLATAHKRNHGWNALHRSFASHRMSGHFETLSARTVFEALLLGAQAHHECLAQSGALGPSLRGDMQGGRHRGAQRAESLEVITAALPVLGGTRFAEGRGEMQDAKEHAPRTSRRCFWCHPQGADEDGNGAGSGPRAIESDNSHDDCCESFVAKESYAAGGYACARCLTRFARKDTHSACGDANASLREHCRLPEFWWRRTGMFWPTDHPGIPWQLSLPHGTGSRRA